MFICRRVGKRATRSLDVIHNLARVCPRVAIDREANLATVRPRGQDRWRGVFVTAPLRQAILPTLQIIAALLLAAGMARAELDYPRRPVTMVVPLPAGGTADLLCRF